MTAHSLITDSQNTPSGLRKAGRKHNNLELCTIMPLFLQGPHGVSMPRYSGVVSRARYARRYSLPSVGGTYSTLHSNLTSLIRLCLYPYDCIIGTFLAQLPSSVHSPLLGDFYSRARVRMRCLCCASAATDPLVAKMRDRCLQHIPFSR